MTAKSRSGYDLPVEPSNPSSSLGNYTTLMYGEKKIGKTTFWRHSVKPFYFMFEPGGKALRINQDAFTNNWPKFRRAVQKFVKSSRFQTAVIDTADRCYEACSAYVCKKMGVDHPSDLGYGKGWEAVRREFGEVMDKLLLSGKAVVFLSHAKEYEVKRRDGSTFDRTSATMAGQAIAFVEAVVDIWCYYHYGRSGKRVIQILGDEEISAGHRVEGRFQYSDGTPIGMIPAGASSQEAFENYEAAFNNAVDRPVRKSRTSKKTTKQRRRRN